MIRELVATPDSALRRHMLGEHAEWGAHEENTARLYEVQAYLLDIEWARETTDPDDPDLKKERLDAKRRGVKPPRHPLIPPVALRPAGIAEKRLNEYLEQAAARVEPPKKTRRSISRAEFDRAMKLD